MNQFMSALDAFLANFDEEPRNLVGEAAIEVAGALFPPLGLGNALRKLFSPDRQVQNLRLLAETIKIDFQYQENRLRDLHGHIENHEERLKKQEASLAEFEAKLSGPEFEDATIAAFDESVRTTDREKIKRFALILVRSFLPQGSDYGVTDPAALIRDVSRLGKDDIYVLRILRDAFKGVIKFLPNLNKNDYFTEKAKEVLQTVDSLQIHRDDFYAHCLRLSGFGFVVEVPRNPMRMAPEDYCFRPTRRGLHLLEMLSDE
jgi:hypothetical protein